MFILFGIIYVIVAQLIYLTRKELLLDKFLMCYMITEVKLPYGLLMNTSEDESESFKLRTRVSTIVVNSNSVV